MSNVLRCIDVLRVKSGKFRIPDQKHEACSLASNESVLLGSFSDESSSRSQLVCSPNETNFHSPPPPPHLFVYRILGFRTFFVRA